MRFVWLLFSAAILSLLSAADSARSEDDHKWVLEQLMEKFRDFRIVNQYAVIYLPPPNNPVRQLMLVPSRPDYQPSTPNDREQREREVLYPEVYENNDPAFTRNYAVAIPDFRGATYGHQMGRNVGSRTPAIHTEDLLINLVFPNMLTWFNNQYGNRSPSAIYIFTNFLPCPDCFQIIQDLQISAPGVPIYVGFADLYGGYRDRSDPAGQLATRNRQNTIQSYLLSIGGALFQLGLCSARGHSRGLTKRSTDLTCPASTQNNLFIITMDFDSGKAVVQYNGIRPSSNGWIGLYNDRGEKQTYEWTNDESAGERVFTSSSGYLSEGYEVRYFTGRSENTLAMTSYRWNRCNFGWVPLNKLPASYGRSFIKLIIHKGYPVVKLKIGNTAAIYEYDAVYLQTIDQMDSVNEWSYQWVTSMTVNGNERYYEFSQPDSSLSKGFRVKYIYTTYKSLFKYSLHPEGTYDNTSPIWTPGDCRGTGDLNTHGENLGPGDDIIHDEFLI